MENFDKTKPIDVSQEDFDFDKDVEHVIPSYLIEIPTMDDKHAKTYISNEIVLLGEKNPDESNISVYIGNNGQDILQATEKISLQPNVENIHLLTIPSGEDRREREMEIIRGPLIAINITEIMEKSKPSGIEVTYLDDSRVASERNMGWFLFPVEFVKTRMIIYPQNSKQRLKNIKNLKMVTKSKELPFDMENTIFGFLGGKRKQTYKMLRRKKTRKSIKNKSKCIKLHKGKYQKKTRKQIHR